MDMEEIICPKPVPPPPPCPDDDHNLVQDVLGVLTFETCTKCGYRQIKYQNTIYKGVKILEARMRM